MTTLSGEGGSYSFRNVPAGTYSLTVTIKGFASFVREGIKVGAASIALDVRMTIQTDSQEVNVTTENTTSVSVDPDQNASSVVIKNKDLEALSDDPDELSSQHWQDRQPDRTAARSMSTVLQVANCRRSHRSRNSD